MQAIRIALWIGLVLASLSRPTMAGPTADCLDTMGLAYVSGQSYLSAGASFAWVYGSDTAFVSCDPPDIISQDLFAGGHAASAGHAAGVGSYFVSRALVSPGAANARSLHTLSLIYAFHVVPDDPGSTDPVSLEITTRHRFGADAVTASGTGTASNAHSADYELRRDTFDGNTVGFPWENNFPIVPDGYFDLVHAVDVPVNVPLYFIAKILQQSDASTGTGFGSGGAALASLWTLEATTPDAATVVFEFENLLGLAPPELDDVPEPALGLAIVPLAAMAASIAGRSRRRRERARDPLDPRARL